MASEDNINKTTLDLQNSIAHLSLVKMLEDVSENVRLTAEEKTLFLELLEIGGDSSQILKSLGFSKRLVSYAEKKGWNSLEAWFEAVNNEMVSQYNIKIAKLQADLGKAGITEKHLLELFENLG